jgi:hypothetical protein
MSVRRSLALLLLGALARALPASADAARHIEINGKPVTAAALATVEALERRANGWLPDGSYWYDARSGALGRWGGPTIVLIPAGLELGGPLPANASGGGRGQLTGVFINGRELHPIDVQLLSAFIGVAVPWGRYWVDAQGNAGVEGGPARWNLFVMAHMREQAARQSRGGMTSSGGVRTSPGGCVDASIHHLGGTYSSYSSC